MELLPGTVTHLVYRPGYERSEKVRAAGSERQALILILRRLWKLYLDDHANEICKVIGLFWATHVTHNKTTSKQAKQRRSRPHELNQLKQEGT